MAAITCVGGGTSKYLPIKEIVSCLFIRNSVSKQLLQQAWDKSFLGRNLFQERGGYIFADSDNPRDLQVVLAPRSASRPFRSNEQTNPAIDLEGAARANANPGWVVVANFHTHPLTTNPEPSEADLRNAIRRNVPGIVISKKKIYVYGPEHRSTFVTPEANPREYPNNGDISSFNRNVRGSVREVRENPFSKYN